MCRFLESGPFAIRSSAIASRGVDLSKTSKIIQKYFFIVEKNDFEKKNEIFENLEKSLLKKYFS